MDNNTTPASNLTAVPAGTIVPTSTNAQIIFTEIAPDPIAWAKKGNKVVMGNVADLVIDYELNNRFRAGQKVFGVTVDKDTYDIPSMRASVIEMGGIMEPLLISVRQDGAKIVLRGNRRAITGQELLADVNISPELRKALMTQTPMFLLHGLTSAQERELIQDQTQKEYLWSEDVKYIFALRRDGWSFDRIAMKMWEQFGKWNKKKCTEVREISDPKLKAEKIKTWLNGSLKGHYIYGYDLGEFVRKCILLSEMRLEGILAETNEKPHFLLAGKDSQKRILALREAQKADGDRWNGSIRVEGSEFWKKMDEYHNEDYGLKPTVSKAKAEKMMPRAELESIVSSFSSKAVKAMCHRVLNNVVGSLPALDEFAGQMETKQMLVDNFLARLKPEAAKIMRLVFLNPDPNDFQKFLEENCSVEVAETVPTDGTFKLTEGDGNDEGSTGGESKDATS